MKVYIKFLIKIFTRSFLFVSAIMFCLVIILNLLSELDFFKDMDVETYYPLFLSIINSPSMIFEMLPFIFLLTTQLFYINLFNNKEIEIFKYSGLKNSKILNIIGILSLIFGILITSLFYNFSSSLKNIYLELKSNYSKDGKYLAVITKNGLWIKDKVGDKILIINSSQIEKNYLVDNYITEFDENYKAIRNIKSDKIDILDKDWVVYNPKIFKKNIYEDKKEIKLKTNFDYKRIQSLYSNLSSLNLFELYELRENYLKLNYSLTEVNLQILKLISLPLFLVLMTLFSAAIMMKTKSLKNSTIKIALGLFFSVIIYYINNFFFVLGSTEGLSIVVSIFFPMIILSITNFVLIYGINEK